MSPLELCKALGGTEGLNRLKARVNGKWVILARLQGEEYEFTLEGAALAATENSKVAVGLSDDEPKAKSKARVSKPVVEVVAEESSDLPEGQ